jgi:hypothetical protein
MSDAIRAARIQVWGAIVAAIIGAGTVLYPTLNASRAEDCVARDARIATTEDAHPGLRQVLAGFVDSWTSCAPAWVIVRDEEVDPPVGTALARAVRKELAER